MPIKALAPSQDFQEPIRAITAPGVKLELAPNWNQLFISDRPSLSSPILTNNEDWHFLLMTDVESSQLSTYSCVLAMSRTFKLLVKKKLWNIKQNYLCFQHQLHHIYFFLTKVKNIIILISLCWILICIFVPYFPSHYIESIPSCMLNYPCLCHFCAVSGLCCVLCSERERRQPLLNIKFTINLLLAWSSLTMQ